MSDKRKPAGRVYIHPIQATIWRNLSGENSVFYSVTFERRYRDGDVWKGTQSIGEDALLLMAKCADLAHSKIQELKAADRPEKPAEESEVEVEAA